MSTERADKTLKPAAAAACEAPTPSRPQTTQQTPCWLDSWGTGTAAALPAGDAIRIPFEKPQSGLLTVGPQRTQPGRFQRYNKPSSGCGYHLSSCRCAVTITSHTSQQSTEPAAAHCKPALSVHTETCWASTTTEPGDTLTVSTDARCATAPCITHTYHTQTHARADTYVHKAVPGAASILHPAALNLAPGGTT